MTNAADIKPSLFWPYLLAICRYARLKAVISLALLISLGLSEGIGLLMIIPLLQLIGFGSTAGSGGITAFVGDFLALAGLPLTLPVILGVYVALVTASAVASRFRDVLNMEIIQGFTLFLRNDLYQDLSRVDWLTFTRTRAADLTYVLTAAMEMVGFGIQQLLLLVSILVIAMVNLAVALTLSPAMTALALGIGGLLLLLLRPLNRHALDTGGKLHQDFGIVECEGVPIGRLCEATALRTHDYPGRAPNRRAFQVKFRHPLGPGFLPQRIYPWRNAVLGRIEIFLVPIGPDAEGFRYQALFN